MFGFAKISEKNALGRVLLVCAEAYKWIGSGNLQTDARRLLDGLSKVLSHYKDEKEPISELLKPLKLEIKAMHKPFYAKVKKCFGRGCFVPEFDSDKANRHIPAIIFANDRICAKITNGETDKAKTMCDAMKSYPGYIFGEFGALSSEQFYDLVFGFFPKLYGEEFMEPMECLFK